MSWSHGWLELHVFQRTVLASKCPTCHITSRAHDPRHHSCLCSEPVLGQGGTWSFLCCPGARFSFSSDLQSWTIKSSCPWKEWVGEALSPQRESIYNMTENLGVRKKKPYISILSLIIKCFKQIHWPLRVNRNMNILSKMLQIFILNLKASLEMQLVSISLLNHLTLLVPLL